MFSAPLEEKGIMGGLIELRGDTLSLQGNVFSACCQEEAIALLEGQKVYANHSKTDEFLPHESVESEIQAEQSQH